MSMVERIARIICRHSYLTRYSEDYWRVGELDAKIEAYWPQWKGPARLVIEAMREPTQDQLVAGNAEFHRLETPLNIWRAMIDAALSDPLPNRIDDAAGEGA